MKKILFTLSLVMIMLLAYQDNTSAQIDGYLLDTIGASETITTYSHGDTFAKAKRYAKQGDFKYVAVSDSLSGATNVTIKLQRSLYGTLWVTDTTMLCNGATQQTFQVTRRDLVDQYWRTLKTSPGGAQATKLQEEWIWKEE